MVGGGGECNTRCPSGDDMGVGGYIDGSQRTTNHMVEAVSTEKAVKPLSPGCRVPGVQGGGERDPT